MAQLRIYNIDGMNAVDSVLHSNILEVLAFKNYLLAKADYQNVYSEIASNK